MACKVEYEMLQLEMYVTDVAATAAVFETLFDMTLIEAKQGWRHLRHAANFDFMLLDPVSNVEGEAHWPTPLAGTGGEGIEIVICTTSAQRRRQIAIDMGFDCSDLRFPKWGSTEFLLRLPEGYLLRVKEPPALRTD
jgi:hypothetical protein